MNFKSVVWSPSQSTWKKEGGKGFERVLFVVINTCLHSEGDGMWCFRDLNKELLKFGRKMVKYLRE